LIIFPKCVGKIKVLLKSDELRYFTWRPIYSCDYISLISSYNWKFSDKNCRENQNTFYIPCSSFEKCVIYEMMWKYIVEVGRPQVTILYGTCALHAG